MTISHIELNVNETIENTELCAYTEPSSDSLGSLDEKPEIKENLPIEQEMVEVKVESKEVKEEDDEKDEKLPSQTHETSAIDLINLEKPTQNIGKALQNSRKKTKPTSDLPKTSIPLEKPKRKKCDKNDDTFFKCEHKGCGKLIRKSNKRQHMDRHTDERFECDICHSSLASKNGLRAHFNLHYPKKELKCSICNSIYRSESSLSQHIRFVHNKEPKRFICNICGRALRKAHMLKEHMNKHTGEKPFDCPYDGCERRFFSKAHRSEHLRTHTGEKPFKCPETGCDREFAYATDFRRHKFKAHGIYTNKFPCPICSKIFPENMLLKKHLKSHEVNDS